jgi:DNA-binding transcriptional LysR family regulator
MDYQVELQEIRYFLTLGQTLHFTKGAEVCGVRHPGPTRDV